MAVSREQAFIAHHSDVLTEAWSIAELPNNVSPVPPVSSGADQARFCPQLCWLFLQPNNSHCSTSSAHPAPRVGAFPKFNETRALWQF
jgi:hypothetical protein